MRFRAQFLFKFRSILAVMEAPLVLLSRSEKGGGKVWDLLDAEPPASCLPDSTAEAGPQPVANPCRHSEDYLTCAVQNKHFQVDEREPKVRKEQHVEAG